MRRRTKVLLALAVAAIILFAVTAELPLPVRTDEPKRFSPPPPAVSLLYREADGVMLATCTRVTRLEGQPTRSRFRIDDEIDGLSFGGEDVTLIAEALPGQQYLIYVRRFADPDTGENDGIEVVPGGLIAVDEGQAVYGGAGFALESVLSDIERQKKILSVPAAGYYYGDLASLAAACGEIVVGRVLSVSDPTPTLCRSSSRGESTLSTLDEIFISISVENALSGSASPGQKLSVVLEPWYARPVTNALDLTPHTVPVPPESSPRVGSSYVFFLIKSGDSKSPVYFTVNPYEGYVLLAGDTLVCPYYNGALAGVPDIKKLAEELRLLSEDSNVEQH